MKLERGNERHFTLTQAGSQGAGATRHWIVQIGLARRPRRPAAQWRGARTRYQRPWRNARPASRVRGRRVDPGPSSNLATNHHNEPRRLLAPVVIALSFPLDTTVQQPHLSALHTLHCSADGSPPRCHTLHRRASSISSSGRIYLGSGDCAHPQSVASAPV